MSSLRRRWFRPWKVEYFWHHSAYGMVLGYAWTRRQAQRRLALGVFDVVNGDDS